MKTIYFSGNCPQCELYDEHYKMWDNGKHWECPSCSLQINIDGNYASILRHRGNEHFKFNYKEYKGKIEFQQVDEDSYPNGTQILFKLQLIEYLLKKVAQKPYSCIDKLIDSYIHYILKIANKKFYLEQVDHFKIDFENEEIINGLRDRDQSKKYSEQYKNERLYYFLVNNVLPKYGANDISFLPEMGMSQLEFYLCKKHLPENKIIQITKDKSYSKQALRNFVKDLVDIIYFDKPIFLTGDIKLAAKIKSEMFE